MFVFIKLFGYVILGSIFASFIVSEFLEYLTRIKIDIHTKDTNIYLKRKGYEIKKEKSRYYIDKIDESSNIIIGMHSFDFEQYLEDFLKNDINAEEFYHLVNDKIMELNNKINKIKGTLNV